MECLQQKSSLMEFQQRTQKKKKKFFIYLLTILISLLNFIQVWLSMIIFLVVPTKRDQHFQRTMEMSKFFTLKKKKIWIQFKKLILFPLVLNQNLGDDDGKGLCEMLWILWENWGEQKKKTIQIHDKPLNQFFFTGRMHRWCIEWSRKFNFFFLIFHFFKFLFW